MEYKPKQPVERKEPRMYLGGLGSERKYALSYSGSGQLTGVSYQEIKGGQPRMSETVSTSTYTITRLNLGEYRDMHPALIELRVLDELGR